MTKIAISPNVNGTGTFTLAAPDSNTDRTLTLPDAGGEVLTDTSDIEAQVKTATSATGSAPVFACRAFVNFNGTGTVAIRASGNVSSITDIGTGQYNVNFAAAMPDANYCVASSNPTANDGTKGAVGIDGGFNTATVLKSTTQVRIRTGGANQLAVADFTEIYIAIFR